MFVGRNRKQSKELQGALNNISESSRTVAENTGQLNEKLDAVKSDTEKISKSKIGILSLIVAIITLLVTFGGLSVADVYGGWKSGAEVEVEAEFAVKEPEYEIYLYSEYSTVNVGAETEMTATLNFEADKVAITAFFESGGKETIQLNRKNTMEWQKKVYFDRLGVHKIVVTATAPNGEAVENSIEIEVIPISIDMDMINQFLNIGFDSWHYHYQCLCPIWR